MMKLLAICYMLLSLMLLSCAKKELEDLPEQDCSIALCTEILFWITIKLTDLSGNPVALDRMKVTRAVDGKDLSRTYHAEEWNTFRRLGSYPLVSDSDEKNIPRFKRTKIRFQGYVGNREVVRNDYIVTFDCCHVSLVSGERELVVK